MADINRVVLVGRLVRDAEQKYTPGGLAICEFSVAINNRRKQGDEWVDEANFFDVTLFGRQGEAIQRYLLKGKQVGIDGRLKQDRWQDKETGQNRSKVNIIADNVMLLGSSSDGPGGGGSGGSGGWSKPESGSGPPAGPAGGGRADNDDGFGGDDFPDNIPF
ncbi:MAG: single-stranded DNA-binding protein [Spirochaetaceae bacterium]|nr:MAG: single-stranded DNA-binding protein [Spirochaetaceae bacterium]